MVEVQVAWLLFIYTVKTWTCGAKPSKCPLAFKLTSDRHSPAGNGKVDWIHQILQPVFLFEVCVQVIVHPC